MARSTVRILGEFVVSAFVGRQPVGGGEGTTNVHTRPRTLLIRSGY